MKIKMTANDRKRGRFAGLIYELPDRIAKKYIEADMAIEVREKKEKKVSYGDRKNKS